MTRLDYKDTNKEKSLAGSTFVDAGPNEGHEGEAWSNESTKSSDLLFVVHLCVKFNL